MTRSGTGSLRTPAAQSGTRDSRWLLAASFASGAAGLIYETVWFHRCGLVFGNSVWSTSLVLSSFMGGLTVGSALIALDGHRIRRYLFTYAAVESGVAVSGLLLTYLLPALTGLVVLLTRTAADNLWLINVVRFVTAFAILLVPSSVMGATLPLLVAALARTQAGFGSAFGRAYGWNTLGAVAGVVGTEVWLIGTLGVSGSAWFAALLSLAAAACALRLSQTSEIDTSLPPDTLPAFGVRSAGHDGSLQQVRKLPLLGCSFMSGAALLALEVLWFRFLTMYVLSTTLAASLMLAVVLASIGLGGLVASSWLKRRSHAARFLPGMAFLAGFAIVASYSGFRVLTEGVQISVWYRILWLGLVLTLPTSLLSGIFFTLLGDALQRDLRLETRAAGWLTLANTGGGMLGPLVAAFGMLPMLGMERSFFVMAVMYLLIGAVAMFGVGRTAVHLRSPIVVISGIMLAIALVRFPFGLMSEKYFQRVVQPYSSDGATIVATREGAAETIFLMQQKWMGEPVYTRLVTNGFSMSGTAVPAQRYMRYFVYWPMILHRGPIKRVLVVCYGVGVTAGAATELPAVESIDVAEISRDIVAMSDVIYASKHPLRDPRVRLHLEDGRQLLQATSERFDLITGEPPPPRTPGAENIYSREYFQLINDRLNEGGMTTYWLPVGRPDPGTNVTSIIRAFCDVFSDCSLWNATPFDLMLVGSRGAKGPVPEDEFVKPWQMPALRTRLTEIGLELPQQVGATFIGDAEYLRQLTGKTAPLDDDHPQRLRPVRGTPSLSDPGYGLDPAVTRLYETVLDPARARAAFERSSFIRETWPERVIEGSLPFFEQQAALNKVFWEGGQPLRHIESLHDLLTRTPLRTLPLWLLGSDDVKQRIAHHANDESGATEYARGLAALVGRDYPGAASALAHSERQGLRAQTVRPLLVYSLCLAGRMDDARRLAEISEPRAPEDRHFWEWLGRQFGVGPFGRG